MNQKISIITPTYNESKNIEKLVYLIHKALQDKDYELIIVDDNSPDGTGSIAESLSQKFNIKVLHREGKRGLSSAVIEGFKEAEGNLFCVIDADLSHPPEKIIELWSHLEIKNADMVIGSRLIKGGGTEDWPTGRKFTSYIGALLASPLTKIKDPMSGFFIFKKGIIQKSNLIPRGYKILLEILVKGKYEKVIEYPFIFRNRTAGSSKLDLKTNIEFLRQLLHLYLYKLKYREFK